MQNLCLSVLFFVYYFVSIFVCFSVHYECTTCCPCISCLWNVRPSVTCTGWVSYDHKISGLPWVWEFPWIWIWDEYGYGNCTEFPWVLWEFLNRCAIKRKRKIVFGEPQAAVRYRYVAVAGAWWRNQSNVQPAAVAGQFRRYFTNLSLFVQQLVTAASVLVTSLARLTDIPLIIN